MKAWKKRVEKESSDKQRAYKLIIGGVSISTELFIFILERIDIRIKLFFRQFFRRIPLEMYCHFFLLEYSLPFYI
jgi:hypothetical protein